MSSNHSRSCLLSQPLSPLWGSRIRLWCEYRSPPGGAPARPHGWPGREADGDEQRRSTACIDHGRSPSQTQPLLSCQGCLRSSSRPKPTSARAEARAAAPGEDDPPAMSRGFAHLIAPTCAACSPLTSPHGGKRRQALDAARRQRQAARLPTALSAGKPRPRP